MKSSPDSEHTRVARSVARTRDATCDGINIVRFTKRVDGLSYADLRDTLPDRFLARRTGGRTCEGIANICHSDIKEAICISPLVRFADMNLTGHRSPDTGEGRESSVHLLVVAA